MMITDRMRLFEKKQNLILQKKKHELALSAINTQLRQTRPHWEYQQLMRNKADHTDAMLKVETELADVKVALFHIAEMEFQKRKQESRNDKFSQPAH